MHSLKKILFAIFLLLSTILSAQDASPAMDAYNKFLNYIPKSLEKDTIYNPEIRISQEPFNSIANAMLHYRLKHFTKFSDKEMVWMEEKISNLAIALHAEGNYILLGRTSNGNCNEYNLIKSIYLNTIKITSVDFCHGCLYADVDDDFIEMFNSKMLQLLDIKPSDYVTSRYFGIFEGKGQHLSKIQLTLTKERIFRLTIQKKNSIEFSEGIWENENDVLTLKSKRITPSQNLQANENWIQLDNVNFQLIYRFKRSKLIKLGLDKWKLKKVL